MTARSDFDMDNARAMIAAALAAPKPERRDRLREIQTVVAEWLRVDRERMERELQKGGYVRRQ
jgi:hypothetical protein